MDIKITRGLDIKLQGEPTKELVEIPAVSQVSICMDDFHGITPKMTVKVGDRVDVGSTVFYSKGNDKIKFTSPISGEISEIERGAKRKILNVNIKPSSSQTSVDFGSNDISSLDAESVKDKLLNSGCWAFIKQRPFDIIASPEDSPKAIFISGLESNPIASDLSFVLKGKEKQLSSAIEVLSKLTSGKVHITTEKSDKSSPLLGIDKATYHTISGKNPKGNVGVQINKIDPINKDEIVWVVSAQDLVVIGELFLTGKYNPTRIVAVAGSQIQNPKYIKASIGTSISDILKNNLKDGNSRIINGNVLTGKKASLKGSLGYYSKEITAIEEGDEYKFMGWVFPDTSRFSAMKTGFMSSFLGKKYSLSANTNGEHRALVMTGLYDKVFPFDIFPLQLVKSMMIGDIDDMEKLGIYEIAPEDFALAEFVCVSKTNIQKITRDALDLMIKELS